MQRTLKQILYGGFYLSIFGIIVYFIIFKFFFPPSCSDGIKNQGEEGIDCGGPCPSCEIRTLFPIQVNRTVFFVKESEGTIDLAAQIKNPNLSWGIKKFNYSFILKDENGNEAGRITGTSFILPGETRWIIRSGGTRNIPLIKLPQAVRVTDVVFEIEPIIPTDWQKLRSFTKEAEIISKNVRFEYLKPPRAGFAELRGEIENRSSFLIDQVEINAVLFGEGDLVLAVGQTMARTLKPGETRYFAISWPIKFSGKVVRWDVRGHANFLIDETFVKQFGL